MDDLISRQAAIALAKDIIVPTKDGSAYKHRCIDPDEIRELPSAQPEIIRCKDCKHRPVAGEATQGFEVEFPDYICPCQCDDGWYNWRPNDEWYCANAERETDE